MTMAQGSNGTAPRYDGMPNSAVAGGAVDLLIPVKDMPGRLAALLLHPVDWAPAEGTGGVAADEHAATQESICALLRAAIGHDFSGYKAKTFFRRVHRRMQVAGIATIPAYIGAIRDDLDEAGHLFRDLLIGVMGFFRDSGAFAALEAGVMRRLFEERGADDTVRIWVPGCATGEEAYSLAILAREQAARLPFPPACRSSPPTSTRGL